MLSSHSSPPKRYRLQFLGEELDFPVNGTAVIGRSATCDITIFDPLISRRHARIVIEPEQATIEDLGSHNGTRVNGVRIYTACQIEPSDRIGLGKNEFVFREVGSSDGPGNTTGSLVYCASCALVYPKETGVCPHCASRETVTQVTKSGIYNEESHDGWAVQMLISLLGKAIAVHDRERAEGLMREIMAKMDAKSGGCVALEPSDRDALLMAAVKLSEATGEERWHTWAEQGIARASFRASRKLLRSG